MILWFKLKILALFTVLFWNWLQKYNKFYKLFINQIRKCYCEKKLHDNIRVKKILVFSLKGIGNSVMRIPMVKNLKIRFPQSRITVVMSKKYHASVIWKNNDDVDKIIELDVEKLNLLRTFEFLLHAFPEYDLSIIPFASTQPISFLLSIMAGCDEVVCHDLASNELTESIQNIRKISYDHSLHEIENNNRLIQEKFRNFNPFINLSRKELNWSNSFIENNGWSCEAIIGIHAGCQPNWPFKKWPIQSFSELIMNINEKHKVKFILFGTDLEKKNNQEIMKKTKGICFDGTSKFSLGQTISLMSRCQLFISNDSGLMHIANAIKIPLITLFGATSPVKNAPYIQYDECYVIQSTLDCAPCIKKAGDKKPDCIDAECMKNIPVKQVLEKSLELLSR